MNKNHIINVPTPIKIQTIKLDGLTNNSFIAIVAFAYVLNNPTVKNNDINIKNKGTKYFKMPNIELKKFINSFIISPYIMHNNINWHSNCS